MSRRSDRFTPDRIDTFWRREAARRSSFSGKTLGLVLALGMMIGWQAPDWWARLAPEIAMPTASTSTAPSSASADQLSADFGYCHSGGGTNCVVDGDTFWFRGEKYRIADIDTPETHGPRCPEEGALGARATSRLQQLMNAGPFSLEIDGRATDKYGRALRIVTRDGQSIGQQLVAEGLARTWDGRRHPWC
ncbi:thermonuclease family protein [Sphingobium yanoikuyae]|uniref:thermonuclease family protein n=1 Tax=Sphingobium yanoikuyae TaxID=13690 RepID=UPI0028A8F8F8|nr:thermonuclease family protein [Sphingobium yanoikuyae]